MLPWPQIPEDVFADYDQYYDASTAQSPISDRDSGLITFRASSSVGSAQGNKR